MTAGACLQHAPAFPREPGGEYKPNLAPKLHQPAYDEGADFGDPFEVAVDVNDPKPVVQGRASDEEIGDRRSVPHPMVMGQVPLEFERALE